MMKVGELKAFLVNIPDDMEIVKERYPGALVRAFNMGTVGVIPSDEIDRLSHEWKVPINSKWKPEIQRIKVFYIG